MIQNDTRYYAERGIEPPAVPGHKWLPKWGTSLERGNRIEAYIQVKIDKPPKLRYRPGQYVMYKNQLYEIRYCFRTATDPGEWCFVLFERKSAVEKPMPEIQAIQVTKLGAGSQIKLVVSELFKSEMDAHEYFSDIYRDASSILLMNKSMVQHAKVVSSGPLILSSVNKGV